MKLSIRRMWLLIPLIFLGITSLNAMEGSSNVNKRVTLSGHIKDAQTGEVLIGSTIYVKEEGTGTIANLYGFYSISLAPGEYNISFAYLGYDDQSKVVKLEDDMVLDITLKPSSEQIGEVVITSEKKNVNIVAPQMGVQKLQGKAIKNVPVLMGETDLVKVLQLLPGVQASSEGSSGFSVRGGNPDQNLILLDEAIVYNAGHMMGFFSVFNNDAIKDVKLYKGDIPASNGGRLASLLDVRMKDGNAKKFSGTGGFGTVSSRLTLEGPVFSEKTSFVMSGRRTYADLLLPLAGDESIRDNKLYFYDLNAKINHTFNENNRIYLSGYFGRDVFKNGYSKMDFGNQTLTARWNHIFTPRLFSNFTFVTSNYEYGLESTSGGSDSFIWDSTLRDYSVKVDFSYFLNPKNTIHFGGQSIYHTMMPGLARGKDENSLYNEIRVPDVNSLEHAIYASNTQKFSNWLVVKYGLRYSVFQNIGEGTVFDYDEKGNVTGETKHSDGDIYHTYSGLEPRLSMNFIINPSTSIKASYSKTMQYLHMASNSTSSSPLDVWFTSSPNVKPQKSDQYSAGFFKNFDDNTIETSIEGFYKDMRNTIDFKDHADLLLNEHLDGELRFGNSWAYGIELLMKFNREKWSGWVGYTWSRSERKIEGVNNGLTYLSPYDHTHDISIVFNRRLTKRAQLSMNWVYSTGAPVTYPVGRYELGGNIVPLYSKRNAERMPDYHRLDVSYTIKGKERKGKNWHGEWVFSLYNAYGRHNAWTINFVQDEDDPYKTNAEKTYLFSVVPSITYNFKF
ncbi:TonB-dependent receptor [Marinilabiliaceae bacterium JC017]|nr:TonB-dependent receptor [Marinilabiliaceae bacterium JC017]